MAARKRKSTSPGKTDPAEVQTPIDGVLVRVDGNQRHIQSLGASKVTELPTLLRQAAKDVERELGID
jgi:hypothetical protein